MRLYHPKARVKIIKAIKRDELIKDVAIAERYKKIKAINLTPYLSDGGAIRTSKSVREPAGGFSITVADQPYYDDNGDMIDTISALIEPMDLVELRFCHDPVDYAEEDKGYKPPVVMRGLVTTISRTEAMSGGKPQRQVVISGQDFGKILQIIQIIYLNNSWIGDNYLTEFAFFHKYAGEGVAKIKSAKDFIADVITGCVDPYLQSLTAFANGESVGAKVINKWTPNVTIKGAISPYAVASFNNVSLYQMLAALMDVGPFNEMYVEDLEEGIQLTVRPNPYLDVKGKPIQGERASSYVISDDDIESISLSRTDGGVANYYWVSNARWSMMGNEDQKMLATRGKLTDYILFDYQNTKKAYYGVRKMEVESSLGPDDYANYEAQTKKDLPIQNKSLGEWLTERRKILADTNKDNVIFEYGTIRMRGDEHIKAGMQIYIKRSNAVVTTCYVTNVDHEYLPYGRFTTTLTVERATNFIERTKAEESQYFHEINAHGVIESAS